jgi:hypothetical protein
MPPLPPSNPDLDPDLSWQANTAHQPPLTERERGEQATTVRAPAPSPIGEDSATANVLRVSDIDGSRQLRFTIAVAAMAAVVVVLAGVLFVLRSTQTSSAHAHATYSRVPHRVSHQHRGNRHPRHPHSRVKRSDKRRPTGTLPTLVLCRTSCDNAQAAMQAPSAFVPSGEPRRPASAPAGETGPVEFGFEE